MLAIKVKEHEAMVEERENIHSLQRLLISIFDMVHGKMKRLARFPFSCEMLPPFLLLYVQMRVRTSWPWNADSRICAWCSS